MDVELKETGGFILKEDGALTFKAILTSHAPCGDYGLMLNCYENGKECCSVMQKSWATSSFLRTGLYWSPEYDKVMEKSYFNRASEETCTDPRILMLHILSGKLMLMQHWAGYDETQAEKEINAVLPNPTIEEAEKWLERNRFTGENAYSKTKRRTDYPGWDIANDDYDFVYLTPEIRVLYDKYKRLWKEREARRND